MKSDKRLISLATIINAESALARELVETLLHCRSFAVRSRDGIAREIKQIRELREAVTRTYPNFEFLPLRPLTKDQVNAWHSLQAQKQMIRIDALLGKLKAA